MSYIIFAEHCKKGWGVGVRGCVVYFQGDPSFPDDAAAAVLDSRIQSLMED